LKCRGIPHFSLKSGVRDFCSCKLNIPDTDPSLAQKASVTVQGLAHLCRAVPYYLEHALGASFPANRSLVHSSTASSAILRTPQRHSNYGTYIRLAAASARMQPLRSPCLSSQSMVQGLSPSPDILPAISRLVGMIGGIVVVIVAAALFEPLVVHAIRLVTTMANALINHSSR
jgi:hypothetical protein